MDYVYKNHLQELLELYPEKKWNYMMITENSNLPGKRLTFAILSKDSDAIRVDIKDFGMYNWFNYDILSDSLNLTWAIIEDVIKDRKDNPWSMFRLSRNPNITLDIVKDNPQYKWDHNYLSMNPNVTWDVVRSNEDILWNYMWLSSNPNIEWDVIRNHTQYGWNYSYMIENPSLTLDIIRDFCSRTFPDNHLSMNPNITSQFVKDMSDKYGDVWNFEWMSCNEFERHPVFMNRIRRKAIRESDILPRVLADVVAGFCGFVE